VSHLAVNSHQLFLGDDDFPGLISYVCKEIRMCCRCFGATHKLDGWASLLWFFNMLDWGARGHGSNSNRTDSICAPSLLSTLYTNVSSNFLKSVCA